MASRSRKRRKPATRKPPAQSGAPATPGTRPPEADAPARRTKRPDADARHGPSPTRLRGEAANEAIRAGITPLQPGERPAPLKIAVAVSLLLAAANVVLIATDYDPPGRENPSSATAWIFVLVLLVAAGGMWFQRYWAVLGFQVLLGLTAVVAGLSVLVASNVLAVVVCLVTLLATGWLFYKLVRVLGRMQAPQRPVKP